MKNVRTSRPYALAPGIGEKERDRILDLKGNHDKQDLLLTFAQRYRKLGWSLVALDVDKDTEVALDFSRDQELWPDFMRDMEAKGVQVGVGVRTGTASRLFVLEVPPGKTALDHTGDWRSDCLAQGADNLERQYFLLPPGCRLPSTALKGEADIKIYGEDSRVLAPPSLESQSSQPWRWQTPPWVRPPRQPRPALWQFLKNHVTGAIGSIQKPEPEIPSWEEIYRLVSPCATVLQALLAPAATPEEYYDGLLKAALGVGLKEPSLLLGLLWHAPHGDALHHPNRWEYLQELVSGELQEQGPPEAPSKPLSEPLMILGERITVERCRYEAMLFEMRKLSTKAAELEQRLAEWGEGFFPAKMPAEGSAPSCLARQDGYSLGFLQEWTDLERQVAELVENFLPSRPVGEDQHITLLEKDGTLPLGMLQQWDQVTQPRVEPDEEVDELEEAIQDCLEENPELAADERRLEMLYYCLKNYVNFHPDFVGLPVKERVAEAGRMAKDFMKESPAVGNG